MTRAIALLSALVLSIAGLGAGLGPATAADETGSIAGTVTNPNGDRVDGMYVVAWQWDPDERFWSQYTQAVTAVGDYTVSDLPPGSYRIEFQATLYQPEFWRDAPSVQKARSITVTAGRKVTGIDAQLASGALLSGKVARADDAQPLRDIDVLAHWWNPTSKSWDVRATARTASDGSYLLRGLAPGSYRIQFSDYVNRQYARRFWPDATSLETATTITVDTNGVWDTDVVLSTDPVPEITNLVAPAITGTARVGERLTAIPGAWEPAPGVTYTYQWFIGLRSVDGATASTFVPPDGTGKEVTVQVSAALAGYATGTETSPPTTALLPPVVANTEPPGLSGTPRVGAPVTATPGTWNPGDAALGYQWLLDGRPVGGATSRSFTPRATSGGRSACASRPAARAGSARRGPRPLRGSRPARCGPRSGRR